MNYYKLLIERSKDLFEKKIIDSDYEDPFLLERQQLIDQTAYFLSYIPTKEDILEIGGLFVGDWYFDPKEFRFYNKRSNHGYRDICDAYNYLQLGEKLNRNHPKVKEIPYLTELLPEIFE